MRLLLLAALLGLIVLVTAKPTLVDDREEPNVLLDVADAGDLHSNDADRQARHWGGGWEGPRWGGGYGGWGGSGWGGGHGGWGGRRWGGGYGGYGGWGGYGWRGGGWGGGYWG